MYWRPFRKFNGACKYLHISSAAVYGNPEKLPILEDDPKVPLSPYGWHKLMSELACAEYNKVYGLSTAIIRPFSVYGNGLQKQLLWDICRRLQTNETIKLFGTGDESRDFIHCTDLVKLMDTVVTRGNFKGEVYNAASGIEIAIRDIANIFETHYNGRKKILFTGEGRAGDPINWQADVSKINSLGFSVSVRLDEGITDYIHWFLECMD